MEEMLSSLKENVESLTVLLQQARDAETQASTALEQFDQHSVAVANVSNASRARRTNQGRQNYRAMSNPDSCPNANEVAQNNERHVLVDALVAARATRELRETDHNATVSALASARDGKLVSKDDFIAHAKEMTTPIFEDYKMLFLDANGPFKKLTVTFSAARVLNPLVAKDMNQATIEATVEELRSFGVDVFCENGGIIEEMVNEIPAYMAKVASTNEEGAEEYDEDLATKAVEDPVKYDNKTWRDDPIDMARRMWEWWRSYKDDSAIYQLVVAARHVALVQVSLVQAVKECST
jgi:hypothetical protein